MPNTPTTITPTITAFLKHEHFDAEGCAVVYDAVAEYGPITQADLASLLDLSQQTIYRRLQVMYHAGHVDSSKSAEGIYLWTAVPLPYRRAN